MNRFAATAVSPVELSDLGRGCPGRAQRLAFGHDLAHQSDLLRLGGVKTAAGQQQVAHDRIAQIPLQARDSAESRNQSQPQFRKTKTRHLVGNDQIADQRQFKPSAKGHAVNGGNGGQRRGIDAIQHAVNAFQKIAHALEQPRLFPSSATLVKLAQISPGAEPGLQLAVDDESMRLIFQLVQRSREFFQFLQATASPVRCRAAMQRQFDDSAPEPATTAPAL